MSVDPFDLENIEAAPPPFEAGAVQGPGTNKINNLADLFFAVDDRQKALVDA